MKDGQRIDRLHEDMEQQRITFIGNDIDLCMTFLDTAGIETRLHEPDAAASALEKARRGYEAASVFLTHITPGHGSQRKMLEEKLEKLKQKLERVEATLKSGSGADPD